jgi:hypothetical protein
MAAGVAIRLRGQAVILDSDLAALYGVTGNGITCIVMHQATIASKESMGRAWLRHRTSLIQNELRRKSRVYLTLEAWNWLAKGCFKVLWQLVFKPPWVLSPQQRGGGQCS